MKIAIISSLFPPFAIGGAEEVAAQLALALHRMGAEVNVISTCRKSALTGGSYTVDDWEGIRVWRIAPWNLYWRFDRHPNRLVRAGWHTVDLWNPSVLRPLREVLDQIRPEVINTHNIDGLSPAVWQVARDFTRAIAHTLHDYHLVCPRATMYRADGTACESLCNLCGIYAYYHKFFQSYVRALIAPSKSVGEMHRDSGWTGPALQMVHNAVDTGEVHVPRKPEKAPLSVLYLSRLEREKGCETLLRTALLFRDRNEIEFHVAGSGSYEKRFESLARQMPNVRWHSFVSGSAKQELLSQADVYLQLSECRENAPLGLLEARRYGLYLVGTRIGGIPEQIDSPETGRLIAAADPQALFETLEELRMAAPGVRAGRAARICRNAGYGMRQMAEQYVRVFESILDS